MNNIHLIGRIKALLHTRKFKVALVFFICWFALWVLIVDGIIGFQKLQDLVGSYILLESTLILIVIIPSVIVFFLTKEKKS